MADSDISLREYLEHALGVQSATLEGYIGEHRRLHEELARQVIRAADELNHRLDEMNALRQQVTSERGIFATRDLLDSRITGTNERMESIVALTNSHFATNGQRIETLERQRANMDGRMAAAAAMLFGLSVVINLGLSIAAHFLR